MSKEELEHINHGTHVAGIVAANSTQVANNNLLVTGMAPNAQLMLMRASSLGKTKDQFSKIYAKAISDSVLLGAKVINMSFGKTADSLGDLHPDVKAAIAYAKEKGVLLVAASGNEGAFGMGSRLPFSSNPDFGTLSSPAISDDVISVAAANPATVLSQSLQVTTDNQIKRVPIFLSAHKSFEAEKTYQFVDAALGEDSDFKNIEVKDKVVLIKRGGKLNFSQKITNAMKAGAAGIVIYNDDALQGNFTIADYFIPEDCQIPVGFVSLKDSEVLKAATNFTFNQAFEVFANNGGSRIISQSSWGVTAEGKMKPDLSAPGFNILSATTGNQYGYESGTSMATPHVAGILSLLQKAYKEKFPELSESQRSQLIKAVAMSSATALYSPEEKAYFSPRHQGAGHIDAKKALEADYYLTALDNQAKINLGNVKDQFVIKLNVNSLKKHQGSKTLYFQVNLGTDKTKDGHFELQPRALASTEWQAITIANDVEEVTITMDASLYTAELQKEMPNGYFLEGFVRFTDNLETKKEVMSIPFSGFRGDFANLPALEESIYSKLKTGTFYYAPVTDGLENQLDFAFAGLSFEEVLNNNNSYTALLTEATPWFLSNDIKAGILAELSPYGASEVPKPIVLGTFAKQVNDEEHYTLDLDQNDQVYLAISPNQDQNRDSITPQVTFLRNVRDVQAQVLDASGNVIWSSEVAAAYIKNYTNNGKESDGSYKLEKLVWDGTDNNQMTVADGNYIYRLLYSPVAEGAHQQMMNFSVIVSTKVPSLPTGVHYDAETGQLKVEESNHQNGLPIYRTFVAFEYDDASEESLSSETIEGENSQATEASEEDLFDMPFKYSVYFYADENGYINIPKTIKSEDGKDITIDFEKLVFVVEDKAGNFNSINLSELLKQSQSDKQPELKEQDELALPEMPETTEKEESNKSEQRQTMTREVTKTAEQLTSKKPISHLSTQQSLPQTSDRKGKLSTILGGLLILIASFFGYSKQQKED
ncbi:S8 family serine peptidase [Streptococcus dysgalactiae]|uniref:S8 family serine peptidase n=1 Tax=Streptococcus dysgalactiae TaxID=1334 RepID=UPI0021B0A451|nr:S8 family serine peptidase [Streptococcus dysgalactiae]